MFSDTIGQRASKFGHTRRHMFCIYDISYVLRIYKIIYSAPVQSQHPFRLVINLSSLLLQSIRFFEPPLPPSVYHTSQYDFQ